MQCPQPQCLAQNHRSADRCHACGADLFAVRRLDLLATARVFFLAGVALFTFLTLPEQQAAAGLPISSRRSALLFGIIYLALGKWLPVILVWGAGAVCLGLAWRARRNPDRSPAEYQRREVILPPNVLVVYRRFGFSLVLVFSLFVLLAWLGVAPILAASRGVPTPASWLIFLTHPLLMVLVLGVTRAVRRQARQSVEDYWATPEARVRVFLVWFLIAVLGMVFALTYLFTGETIALVATGSACAVYWLCGPGEFTTAD